MQQTEAELKLESFKEDSAQKVKELHGDLYN
jgi:hypothetical protein